MAFWPIGGDMKQTILFLLGGVFLVFLTGCNTIEGTLRGAKSTAGGATKGAVQDFSQTWKKVNKIDDWLQKHAW